MREYQAKFIMGGETVSVPFTAGCPITPPATVPDYEGMKFACWDRDLTRTSYGDMTIRAVYTDVLSPEEMARCYRYDDWQYEGHGYHDTCRAAMVYSLVYQEYNHPQPSGVIADRVIKHLTRYFWHSGNLIDFDFSTNWAFGVTAALFAMLKQTPTIWDRVSTAHKEKIDVFMEALLYLESYATSDQNEFRTGPGMHGNTYKNWNANYAFGNVPCMVFCSYYFGNGDVALGAKVANDMCKSFTEETYERMLSLFKKFRWGNAYLTWTTPGPVDAEGKVGPDAKTLLCYGGEAMGSYHMDPTKIIPLGYGKGVTNGGEDYTYSNPNPTRGTYKNIPLTRPEDIFRSMVDYNYAWITKTDHRYDFGDGEGEKLIAWIADGTTTPYLGMDGMMYEFAIGVRSSTGYCGHNFMMLIPHFSCAKALKRYTHKDGERVLLTDEGGNPIPLFDYTADAEAWRRIQVGNEDFLYKIRHGYQCYARGSYGTSAHEEHEYMVHEGQFVMKDLWRTSMLCYGDLPSADTYDGTN